MKALFEKFKNKQSVIFTVAVVIIIAIAVVVAMIVRYNGNDTNSRLPDTEAMNFSFEEEDITTQSRDEKAEEIILTDEDDSADEETKEPKETKETDETAEVTTIDSNESDVDDDSADTTASTVTTKNKSTDKTTAKQTNKSTATSMQTESTAAVTTANSDSREESSDSLVKITTGGTYTLSGSRSDGMLTVDADGQVVNIILNGVSISNPSGPAIYVRAADKVILTVADGTTNTLSDGLSYNINDGGSAVQGAIFSKADLTINGNGTLNVNGNYKHGVVSKDDLVISSATLNVNSKNVALEGKDCVKINNAFLSVNAGSDGIRSDNIEDASRGYIYINGGKLDIDVGNDAIQAETVINLENAVLSITSGGGSSNNTTSTRSHKGLKSGADMYISGGDIIIDSKDDSINSGATLTITGGSYDLTSGDDGVHSYTDLVISSGNIDIRASGDCIDSKASVSITDSYVTVCGPASGKPSIIDYDTTCIISGGSFVGLGSSTGCVNMSDSSLQPVLLFKVGLQAGGTKIILTDSDGNSVLSYSADLAYSCAMISSPSLVVGEVYTITAGSYTATVTVTDIINTY